MDENLENDPIIELELGDELDLHHFLPRDVKDVVQDYLDHACRENWKSVRIIHGKGIGTLRKIVYSILERHPGVKSYNQGSMDSGSWGAVIVYLKGSREQEASETKK